MVDFAEPELVISQPYADGHKDVLLDYPRNQNYNAVLVQIPAQTLFRHMGGHCILKSVHARHIGTLGVSAQLVILPRGDVTTFIYLDAYVSTLATDPMNWANLNISIFPKRGQTVTVIGEFLMAGYVGTEDMDLAIELEWWP